MTPPRQVPCRHCQGTGHVPIGQVSARTHEALRKLGRATAVQVATAMGESVDKTYGRLVMIEMQRLATTRLEGGNGVGRMVRTWEAV